MKLWLLLSQAKIVRVSWMVQVGPKKSQSFLYRRGMQMSQSQRGMTEARSEWCNMRTTQPPLEGEDGRKGSWAREWKQPQEARIDKKQILCKSFYKGTRSGQGIDFTPVRQSIFWQTELWDVKFVSWSHQDCGTLF